MPRARNIKPGFFRNEDLAELPCETRLLFIGLWTLADREGRLEDRPKRIKMEIFPGDSFDVDSMLDDLQSANLVLRYEVDGRRYIHIPKFVKHQQPHYREKASELPPPPGGSDQIVAKNVTRTQRARVLERDDHTCQSCGATEHLCIDHVIPVSRGGTSDDSNLQVLCLPCNTAKGNRVAVDDSGSDERRPDVDSRQSPSARLNPDSLNPDCLNPESLRDLTVSSKAKPPTPYSEIVDLYHQQLPDLARVVKLTDQRRQRLRKIHEGIMERDLDNWRGYWGAVRRSDFLMGRKKDWRADFDFLTRPNTPLKVLEGSYS